jgi:hypothetical protein
MYSSKNVSDYILLSTFERKTVFSAIYYPKSAQNHLFFLRFHIFWVAWKAYLTSITFSTTTPGRALSPPIVSALSGSGATLTVSSSF